MTIEWLLHWAFGREKVHQARMPGMGDVARFVPRGIGGADSSARLGAAVGSSMNLGFEAPADAYAVMHAVNALGPMARVVRAFALANGRPDWTPQPKLWIEPGTVVGVVVFERDGTRLKTRKGADYLSEFQMFAIRGDLPDIVAERRAAYGRWAKAVARVRRDLVDNLAEHVLSDELPPMAPWTG